MNQLKDITFKIQRDKSMLSYKWKDFVNSEIGGIWIYTKSSLLKLTIVFTLSMLSRRCALVQRQFMMESAQLSSFKLIRLSNFILWYWWGPLWKTSIYQGTGFFLAYIENCGWFLDCNHVWQSLNYTLDIRPSFMKKK